MTTAGTSNIGQTGATLSASFSGVTGGKIYDAYFQYGTSSSSLTETVYFGDTYTIEDSASGSFSVPVSSLNPGTTYYYRAVIQVGEKDFYGDVKSFITLQASNPDGIPEWLEMPAAKSGSNYFSESLGRGTGRNYSYLYDKSMYTALWSAYPLTKSHTEGPASTATWSFNPNVPQTSQIDVKSSSYQSNYNAGDYSRGHQVPAADRKCDNSMRAQLYYLTNQTPQLQNNFNGSIWSSLETAVRGLTSSIDTVYVVTGAAFRKTGGSETIKYLTASSSSIKPSSVPVPNYYWKVLLKVKRSGNTITSASAVGFWFDHKAYSSGSSYASYAVSVDQIEAWTGFDFFVNLPDGVESSAEANTSWSTFSSF